MGERGQYRSIAITLLDGPDYRRLAPEARHCFVVLKLNLGFAGIEVRYPEELAPRIAAQTGYVTPTVNKALDELDGTGWVRREENIIWLVGQLEHDPHLTPSDGKHRKGLLRHLAGLPHLAIVAEFAASHPAWCKAEEMRLMGLAWALEGPYKGLVSRGQVPESPESGRNGVNPLKQGPSKGLGSKEKEKEKETKEKEKEAEGAGNGGDVRPETKWLEKLISAFPALKVATQPELEMLATLSAKFSAKTTGTRFKLVGEIAAALEGMHGPRRTWPEIVTNIGDYLLNPAEAANMARLRGYLYRDPNSKQNGTKPTTGQRAFVAADQAMRNL